MVVQGATLRRNHSPALRIGIVLAVTGAHFYAGLILHMRAELPARRG